jgi:quercetin dioxygenase-like cupin family protein
MSPAAATKLNPTSSKVSNGHVPVVASDKLERIQVRASDNPAVRWNAAFAVYGGHGATQSSTIVYEIEPGGELGWHTDATEETQYIIAGKGELRTEEGNYQVGPGSVLLLQTIKSLAISWVAQSWSRHEQTSPKSTTRLFLHSDVHQEAVERRQLAASA